MSGEDVLLAAAFLIERPGCWSKNEMALDAAASPCQARSPQAVAWSAGGALWAASEDYQSPEDAYELLASLYAGERVTDPVRKMQIVETINVTSPHALAVAELMRTAAAT